MTTSKPTRRNFLLMSTGGAASAFALGILPGASLLPQSAVAQTATDATMASGMYKEAPMLAARVAAGTLPAVDARLPKDPLVMEVAAIGKFGGTIHQQTGNQGGHFYLDGAQLIFPQHTNNDGTIIVPDLCDKVELSADATEITLHFREGLKWSDGTPLGAADVMWWWENEQNNKDLYPNGPSADWAPGGVPAVFTMVDPQTLTIKMAQPRRPMVNMSAHERMSLGATFGQPIKYMSQFHIAFNPDADALAKSLGYDFWHQAYLAQQGHLGSFANKPHVGPWVKIETGSTRELFERNAYFHQVDKEGNQLPYIDQIVLDIVPDRTLQATRTIAGELTQNDVALSQIDVAKENMAKGDYTILPYKNSNPSQCCLAFNLNHKDPVLREIYNDVRFRSAMSRAINRDEMNQSLYFGLGTPAAATINPKA
ncbi:MAG: ABC transporter substrate-binding protein, partial [bacterium]